MLVGMFKKTVRGLCVCAILAGTEVVAEIVKFFIA